MQREQLGWLARTISPEDLRAGAPRLLRALRARRHEVWIYTTSLRSAARLRLWFAASGVRLDGIVTHARHRTHLADRWNVCSKYPPAFGIDLLVDDAAGLAIEGGRCGLRVLIVEENDASWSRRVAAANEPGARYSV
jgi:hypothetical protein